MGNLDFSGLTDDQLVGLFRAVCQEAARRDPAVAAAANAAGLDEAEKARIAAVAGEREAAAQRARERQRVAEEAAAKVKAEAAGRQQATVVAEQLARDARRRDRIARAAALVGKRPSDISIVAYAGTIYVNEGHDRYAREHLVRYSAKGIETKRELVKRKPELIALCVELAGLYRDVHLSGADHDWTGYQTNEQPATPAGASL